MANGTCTYVSAHLTSDRTSALVKICIAVNKTCFSRAGVVQFIAVKIDVKANCFAGKENSTALLDIVHA